MLVPASADVHAGWRKLVVVERQGAAAMAFVDRPSILQRLRAPMLSCSPWSRTHSAIPLPRSGAAHLRFVASLALIFPSPFVVKLLWLPYTEPFFARPPSCYDVAPSTIGARCCSVRKLRSA